MLFISSAATQSPQEAHLEWLASAHGNREPADMRPKRLTPPLPLGTLPDFLFGYSPLQVDRIWGIWGSSYEIPKVIFDLLEGLRGPILQLGSSVAANSSCFFLSVTQNS